ncbi:PAS domain S-box protein [Flavihumibacter sp. R14]|nr:PAS domain S-box protein [Flavihumibacter soli]
MQEKDKDQPPWSLVMENTSESFIVLDKDLRIVEFNKVAQQRALDIGIPLNKGDFIIDQAMADRREGLKAMYDEILAGSPKQYYYEGINRDQQPVIYYLEYIPLKTNGEVTGIMVNSRDVTVEQQALKEIRLAEKKFRSLIQEGDDMITIIDHKKEIAFTSPNLTRLSGYESDIFLGRHVEDLIYNYVHPEDQALLLAEFDRIEHLSKLHLVPFRFKTAEGKWECLEGTLTNLRNDEAVSGIVVNSRFITDRIEAEETLKQAYQQITKIFESSLDIICTIDREGRFVQLSTATESLLGYRVEDLRGKYLIDYVHPEDRKETLDILTPLVRGRQIKDLENRIIRSDKTFVPMMWSASINEADGLTYCVGRDMTEKKLTEKRNSDTASLLKSVVQTMDESILVVNTQAELIFANNSFFRVTGELPGNDYETWSEAYPLFDKNTRQKIAKEDQPVIQALNGKNTVGEEFLVINPNNSEFPIVVNASALRSAGGKLIGAMAIKRNVTVQQTTESQLRKKEEQISKIFNTVSDVLFMLKVEGIGKYRFLAANQPFFNATGLTEDRVINKFVDDVIPEPSLTLVLQQYAEAIRLHQQLSWEEVTEYPSGKKTGIVTVTPILDGRGVCIELIGSVNDITSTKEAAEIVYKSNERFEYVTKATSEAIWDWDLISDEFYRGEGFSTLFGVDLEKTTTDVKFWQAYIHPEDKVRILDSLEDALASDAQTWSGQYRYLKADGEFAIVADRSVIIRSEDGKALRMIGAMQDITDRISAENLLKYQNEELVKINQELDSFVYSASHELRSPLTAIMGLITLSRAAKEKTDRDHYHNLMEKSVQNLDQVIKDIISYSKNARLEVVNELINLEELIKESISLFNYMEGGDQVIFNIDINETHPFYSDKNRISTLFNNIISNAIKYRNPEAEQSKVDIKINQRVNSVELSIADNGLGIPEEKLPDVFKMFVRLTSNMPGSGLGLFIVKEILNKLGGTVHLSSVPGKGTTFQISIPNGKEPQSGEAASATAK